MTKEIEALETLDEYSDEQYSAFLEYAEKVGVERVEWAVLDWNLPAITLYQQSGAKVLSDWRIVQMDKKSIQNYVAKIN